MPGKRSMGRRAVRNLLLLAALVWAPGGLAAQTNPPDLEGWQFGLGFVANAPEEVVGFGGYALMPRAGGFGLYVDFKFDPYNPSEEPEFEKDLTATRVLNEVSGARFIKKEASWMGFNAALVRPFNPFLMVYAGGGMAVRTRYWQFEEPSQELGRGGVFWVEAPSEEDQRVNLMLGVIMRLGPRVSSHFGFETQPRGITFGGTLRIPRW